jgi:tape measure domain-containing protein
MTLGDLVVRVGAKIDGYRDAMSTVSSDSAKAAGAAEQSSARIEQTFRNLGPKLASVGATLTVALALPILGVGSAALKASADMESLRMGLSAITHNSAETERQMVRLREVAKIPGLDFQGAVKGSINLQAAGFSAQLAERSLKAFGNALATVGKGREDLEGVNLVLTQILNKPKVMAQDLNQLRERLPQISQAMKAAFGTSVSEDIQKLGVTGEQFVNRIITEFEKLPPVASGLKNTFENVRDSSFQALAKLGDGMAPFAMKFINVVINPMIASVTALAGAFQKLPDSMQNVVIGIAGVLLVAGPALAIFERLLTTATALRDIYLATSAIMTARVIPALVGTQAAVTAVQSSTFALGGTFAATGSTITGSMAAATGSVWTLHAALGALGIVLAGVVTAIAYIQAHKDTFGATGQSTPGKNTAAKMIIGPQGMPVPNPMYIPPSSGPAAAPSRVNAADYVTSLPGPRLVSGGVDADKLKEAFSALGLRDLRKDLDEAMKAFHLLAGSGKLTHEQMLQAAGAIGKLRAELKGVREQIPYATLTGRNPTMEELWGLPSGMHGGVTQDDLAAMPTINRNIGLLNDTLAANATAAALAARNAQIVTGAYAYFGRQTPAELEAVANKSREQWEIMRADGQATPEAIYDAWEQMFRDQIAAQRSTNKITEQQYDDMLAQLDANHKGSTQRRARYERSIAEELGAQWRSATQALERNLARAVLTFKGGFDAIKQLGSNLAEDLLASFFKGFLKPLETQLEKLGTKIGGVFDKIWGKSTPSPGGGGTKAPGVPGGGAGAGAAASSASTGLMGAINMVSGIATAISSVVGNFQMAGMNKSLDVLVNHTLRIFNVVFQMLDEHYLFKGQLFLKLDDIWNSIRSLGAINSGGSSNVLLGSIRDYTRLQVTKIDEFIVPKMDQMIALMGGGALAGAGAAGGGIHFHGCTFTGVTPQLAREVFDKGYREATSKVGR